MKTSRADPEKEEPTALEIVVMVLGVAVQCYLIWNIIVPQEWKIVIRGRVAPVAAAWRDQRAARSDRRRTAFELWLVTQAIEEYNTGHDIEAFRARLGLGSAVPDAQPRAAGMGETETR